MLLVALPAPPCVLGQDGARAPDESSTTHSPGITAQAEACGSGQLEPHETPATGEWIKAPRPRDSTGLTAGLDGHCGFVERDGYVSVQVNVDLLGRNILGDAANEPSIAIDPTDPRKMAIGWRQFDTVESDFRQAGYGYSHDGGRTWTFPGSLTPGVFGSDPVLDADADGNFYYLSINFDEMRLFRSSNGGVTWGLPTYTCPGLHDKPWMVVTNQSSHDLPILLITSSYEEFFVSFDGGTSFVGPADPGHTPWGTIATDSEGLVHIVGGRPSYSVVSDAPLVAGVMPQFERQFLPIHGALLYGIDPNPGGLSGQMWVCTHRPSGARQCVHFGSTRRLLTDGL